MTLNFPLKKSLLTVATMAIFLAPATPAFSAQADLDLLQSYVGSWKGRGETTSSGNTETLVCKLDITKSSTNKVGYNGRCSLAGGNLSIAGTMAYVVERKRFEAVMSSNTSFSGVAIGKRNGKGIAFELRDKNKENGKDYAIDAGIALNGEEISVDFTVLEVSSGKKILATVPFKK